MPQLFRTATARGVAAVEFALVVPVLIALLFGTIEWGRYFYVRESVVHAAREGARGGTLLGATSVTACGAAQAYLDAVGISTTCPGDITVTMEHDIVTAAGTIPGVQVIIDLTFTPLTGLPLALPARVGATAIMPLPIN